MDLETRLKHGELTNPDSIHFADSLKCYTLKKHRTVYGGGGIMPDVLVPLDTMKYTAMHRKLSAKSIIINHDLKFMDKNRKELKKKYPDFKSFDEGFVVPEELTEAIMADGEKEGIKPADDNERMRTVAALTVQLKALVARDLWDMNEYFQIWNRQSDIVRKGVEAFDSLRC